MGIPIYHRLIATEYLETVALIEKGGLFDEHIKREIELYKAAKKLPRREKRRLRKEYRHSIALYKELNKPYSFSWQH